MDDKVLMLLWNFAQMSMFHRRLILSTVRNFNYRATNRNWIFSLLHLNMTFYVMVTRLYMILTIPRLFIHHCGSQTGPHSNCRWSIDAHFCRTNESWFFFIVNNLLYLGKSCCVASSWVFLPCYCLKAGWVRHRANKGTGGHSLETCSYKVRHTCP